MNAKSAVILGLKVLALTIILFISFGVASAITGQIGESRPERAGVVLMTLLIVCFLNTIVLAYPVLRSQWTGWRLVATVFFVFYGVMTVMSQIESAVFLSNMLPPGTLPNLFLLGAIVAGLFSPLAVLILGKMGGEKLYVSNPRLVMPRSEWIWKLIAIVVGYLVLYYTFGYLVAWQNPAVREYYAQIEIPSWLPLFQALRALMWTALALPVIRMMRGQWWEAGLAVGLLFAVLMNSQLLLPNPYMPETVRLTHLVETASSNFIFGWLIVWLLNRHHTSLRELFQLSG
jgi:hypothetical protein